MKSVLRRSTALLVTFVFPLLLVLGAVGVPTAHATSLVQTASPPVLALGPAATQNQPSVWEESAAGFLSEGAIHVAGKILLAILLFIAGWVVAKSIAYAVFTLLNKTELDNELARRLGINLLLQDKGKDGDDGGVLERTVSKVVYILLMLLVIVGVLDLAGLSQVAGPLERLIDTVIQALPRVGKAAVILLVAYVAGRILKMVVTTALDKAGVDKRFAELSDGDAEQAQSRRAFSETAGSVLFWLLIVFGLAGAFEALEIEPLAAPLHNALDRVVGVLPKLAIASLLVFVGWAAGRIARVVVRNLLQGLGFDRLMQRIGLSRLTGNSAPSDVVGMALMVFIILQTTIAALNELGLSTLAGPLTDMVAQFWGILPALAISVVIVAVGVFIGGLLRGLVGTTLRNLGFDRLMERLGFGKLAEREDRLGEFSEMAAYAVQLGVVLLAIAQALDNVQLDTWSVYVNTFLSYLLKNIVVALAVVLVGFIIGSQVRDLIHSRQGDNEAGKWIAEFARYAVLVFAFTMAVRQLDVAEDFVLMTFGLLFGALCLAMALAFGLGSRDVAGDIVKRRYEQAKARMGSNKPTGSLSGKPLGGLGSTFGAKPPTTASTSTDKPSDG